MCIKIFENYELEDNLKELNMEFSRLNYEKVEELSKKGSKDDKCRGILKKNKKDGKK